MNNFSKSQIERDFTCKSHSARSDRAELDRICPSKLSKRELEDLYFALLENNLELKRTLNGQQDRLKALSTKVQRMTATQKNAQGKEINECCAATKAVVCEQKNSIADLKTANERMADRIRLLNMRLCSAKQFLRRSPCGQATARCSWCSAAPAASLKNSSMSALNTKRSESNLKPSVSSQCIDNVARVSMKSVETETQDEDKSSFDKLCDENKCRTLMEELQQKIVNLEEELSNTHEEYSSRISRLEREVSDVRKENVQVRSERIANEHELQHRTRRSSELVANLRAAEANCNELTMQLSIEKRKVAELETQLKAAAMSHNIAKSIDDHLNSEKITPNTNSQFTDDTKVNPNEAKVAESTEDSGYIDANKSDNLVDNKGLDKLNEDLMKKITELESQLDNLKVSNAAGLALENRSSKSFVKDLGGVNINESDDVVAAANKYEDSLVQPEKKTRRKSKRKDSNAVRIKELDNEVTHPENIYDDALMEPEIRRSSSSKHRDADHIDDVATTGGRTVVKQSNDALMVLENRQNSKFDHFDSNDIGKKYIDDEAMAAKKQYDYVLKELENNITIATDKAGELMTTGSNKNVNNDEDVKPDVEQDKSANSPTPWQGVLGSSEESCKCTYKCDKSEKVFAVTTSKDGTTGDALPCTSKTDHNRKEETPQPASSSERGWNKKFFKKLSIDVKTKHTQKNKTRKNSVQENQTSDNINKLANDNINRSVKSTHLNDNGIINETDVSLLTNMNTKGTSPEPTYDAQTQSTVPTNNLKTKDNLSDDKKSNSSKNCKDLPDTYSIRSRDSITVNRNRLNKESTMEGRDRVPMSMNNLYGQCADAAVACTPVSDQAAQADCNAPLEFCGSHTRVCTCPAGKHGAAAMVRTCSGTLQFTTTDSGAGAGVNFRNCDCTKELYSNESCAARVSEGPPAKGTSQDRRGSSTFDRGTYSVRSVSEVLKRNRTTSPENTDCEISSMTDLPSEKDAKSPRPQLSPGEDKATTTYTESYTTPITTDYGTLSEGELPAQNNVRRLSIGEKTVTDAVPMESSSQKMEATLQAITEELARCKQLLRSQRPEEPTRSVSACPRAIALRRATATQSIGDAYAPKCVFTLHIGTVVLSDEAVLNSRNKTLMLTWQFYDQNIAMTRMRAGRVVLFDFSTEYDVKITDDFLHYMKHEEMPLVICELDKPDEPFASCALPLRDALLHTNRRADMSLALIAGPRWQRAAADALDAGDELGVLDLWCVLRAQPRLVPAINRAIAEQSSLPTVSKNNAAQNNLYSSRILEQVVEDEQSIEGRMSQDLDLTLAGQTMRRPIVGTRDDYQNKCEVSERASAPRASQTQPGQSPAAARNQADYDASKYPEMRRHSANPQRNLIKAALADHRPSGIIINEVAASIKSQFDMKQAIERNINNSLHTMQTLPNNEDKGIIAKLRKPRHTSKKDTAQQDRRDSEYNMGNRNRSSRLVGQDLLPQKSYTEEMSHTDIYKKYDNIFKTIGSNKPETSKKSVTIFPKYAEPSVTEEPQKETAASVVGPQCLSITVLWLALNEECEAMVTTRVQRLYVAYSFLGRSGADLETPVSLPKPKHYVDKCYFNFKKTFQLDDEDLPLLGHMARCRAASKTIDPKDCIVFTVVSEPPEDPLGLDNCEDIGYAYLYLGDVVAYSGGSGGYTEVVPVQAARGAAVCGVLAARLDGLALVRRCLLLSHSQRDLSADMWSH